VREDGKSALCCISSLWEFMGRWEEHLKGMVMLGILLMSWKPTTEQRYPKSVFSFLSILPVSTPHQLAIQHREERDNIHRKA